MSSRRRGSAASHAARAVASVADEQRAGAALAQALDAGKRDYKGLSGQDFERIGEYWMGRMLGSTQTHEAMNARMRQMMGPRSEERMHELMGQRYARLATSRRAGRSSGASSYGDCDYDRGPMMDGDYHDGCAYDRGSMMAGDYDWGPMMGAMMGNWRQMSRGDWQQMMRRFDRTAARTGTGGSSGNGGWHARDTLLVAIAALLAAGLAGSLLVRRPWRRRTT